VNNKSTTWHTKSISWHGRAENIALGDHWNAAERETRHVLPPEEATRGTRRQIAIAYLIGLGALTLGECLLRVGQVVFDLTSP